MASTETDLVRVTVRTPQRRLDIGLPPHVPVAALLPVLLRHGGTDLAGLGAAHGGWVLRRLDGTAMPGDTDVATQGVRHGEELRLGFADEAWPEFDYDDVVAAIEAGAGRRGRRWTGAATRIAGAVATTLLLGAALVGVLRAGPPWSGPAAVAALLAVVLLAAGVVAARAYADPGTGAVLAALALPYAFVATLLAGALLVRPGGGSFGHLVTPATLSLASGVVVVLALIAAGAVGRRPVFVAVTVAGLVGISAALFGASGAVTHHVATGTAAATLGALVPLSGLVPSVAIRFGGVPRPVAEPTPGPVDLDRLLGAVARTDDVMAGLLLGVAIAAGVASGVLSVRGGAAGWWLTVAAAASFALRSRAFPAVRHRAAALAGAGVCGAAALVRSTSGGVGAVVGLALAALVVLGLSAGRRETRSPYLGRLADVVEIVTIAAAVPLVCLALGLYGQVRHLHL